MLFDAILELQRNPRIIMDYGELYNAKRNSEELTQKKISNFLTNNNIRVEAHSTQESIRGRLHGAQRPDCLILDDFETNKTKDSEAYTAQVAGHISEAQSGMDATGIVLYLCNYITEYGNVNKLFKRAIDDPRLKVRRVDVLDNLGLPSWPEKYSLYAEPGKVSIEDIRRKLGSQVFDSEMMNNPIDAATQEFKREWFRYIPYEEVIKKPTRKFATIDPAFTKKEGSDWTGITKNYVDSHDTWYLDSKHYKINATDLIGMIFSLHGEGFEKIGIEQGAFTEMIEPFFVKECQVRRTYPYVVPLKHGGVMKETRIRALIPRYEQGKIFHITNRCADLEGELLRFPKSKNDDVCFTKDTKIEVPGGKILGQISTGIQDVYEFMGSKVTANHPYLTQRGFVSLDSLQYSDRIVVWKNKLLMEYLLGDIRIQKGVSIETIFHLLLRNLQVLRQNVSTDIYGKNKTVKYLKALMSTIKIIIQLTTIYLTSNLYHAKSTISFTQIFQKILIDQEKISLKIMFGCKKLLKFGDIVRKVKNGILNIQRKVLINPKKLSVQNVENKSQSILQMQNSAVESVKEDFIHVIGGKNIQATIKYLGREEVFATKTSTGWFTADGVVVSNCDSAQYQTKIAEAYINDGEGGGEEFALYGTRFV